MTASWQGLIGNFSFLALVMMTWTYFRTIHTGLTERRKSWLFGLFTAVGVLGLMLLSIELRPGVLFDLRTAMLAIAGLFGGPIAALLAAGAAAMYRVFVGGPGLQPGLVGIAAAGLLGVLVFGLGRMGLKRPLQVVLLGCLVFPINLLGFVLLPADLRLPAVEDLILPVAGLASLATLLAGFALAESERSANERELLVSALEQAPDFSFVKDRHSRFAMVNRAVARLHGYASARELIGKSDADLEQPQRAEALLVAEQQVLTTGSGIIDMEERIKGLDGAWHWYSTSKVALRNSDNHVIGLAGVTRDVSEAKRLQFELSEARARAEVAAAENAETAKLLETTLETMDQGLMLIRPDETVPIFNRRASELLGLPAEFVETRPTHRQMVDFQQARGDFARVPADALDRIQSPLQYRQTITFEAEQDNGRVLETRSRPLDDGGLVRTFTDITERKAIERDMEAARERAEQANRAKSDFLSTMSHEIRSPLNAVIGFANILLDAPDLCDADRRRVGLIASAGEMLLTVVNDVLDFSRLEAGEVLLDERPVPIREVISDVVATLEAAAQAKGIVVSIEIEPAMPGWLRLDDARLRQVLLNLVSNAIKFTAAGTVVVRLAKRASTQGNRVRLEVVDTGIGIARSEQGKLFTRFTQVDSSISRRYGGSGLGLAISRQLVELMGGAIGLESDLGKGATFWVDLPLVDAAAPLGDASSELVAASRSLRILLADDLPVNAEVASTVLTRAGHRVDIVHDGTQAVRAAGENRYDVILMDVQMPGMDGLSASRAIRALAGASAATPILALTANVVPEQVAAFEDAGMNGYVSKPFRAALLLREVLRAADRPNVVAITQASPEDFDQGQLHELEALVGPLKVEEFRRAFLDQLLEVEPWEADNPLLPDRTHKLVSASGMLGFVALSGAATALEASLSSGARDQLVFEAFKTLVHRARTQLLG